MIKLFLLSPVFCLLSLMARAETVLKIGIVGEPISLNPLQRQSSLEGYINFLYHRNLTHYNGKSETIPHLATESLKFIKSNILGEIRPNAKWDDGTSVTCSDFEAGYRVSVLNSKSDVFLGVDCDPKNPRKVTLKFSRKTLDYPFYFLGPLPAHKEGAVIGKATSIEDYEKNSLYTQKPNSPGLSNGPFKIKDFERGHFLMLERNEHFYGKKPYFDKIIIRFFSNIASLVLAFKAKQIDVISPYGFASEESSQIKTKLASDFPDYKMLETESVYLNHLEFNLDHPQLKDINLRKALSLMVDPVELSTLLDGTKITGSVVHSTDPSYAKEFDTPYFSMKKDQAEKYLKNAGYKLNADGVFEKDEQVLRLNVVYNSENKDHEMVALFLENQWRKAGIETHLQKTPLRILVGEVLKKRNFDIAVMRWSMPKLHYQPHFFIEAEIPNEKNHWAGSNYSGWKNSKAAENYQKATVESNLIKLKKQMRAFQTEFRNDLPWIPLFYTTFRAVVPKKLESYENYPDWEPGTLGSENWEYQ